MKYLFAKIAAKNNIEAQARQCPTKMSACANLAQVEVVVVGTGAMATALCHRFADTAPPNAYLSMADRNIDETDAPYMLKGTCVPVRPLQEALSGADLVILAIPASAYKDLIYKHSYGLAGRVVVDMSKPTTAEMLEACAAIKDVPTPGGVALWLQHALPHSSVIKAFHDIGAHKMMNQLPAIPLSGVAYSDSYKALQQLDMVAKGLNIDLRLESTLKPTADIERCQLSAFPTWRYPLTIMSLVWMFAFTWASTSYILCSQYTWYNAFFRILNTSAAWAGLWGFALAYLPGAAAQLIQHATGRVALRLPCWARSWMRMRKEIALIGLLATFIHFVASIVLTIPGYYPDYFDSAPALTLAPQGTSLDVFGNLETGDVLNGSAMENVSTSSQVVDVLNGSATLTWSAELSYFLGMAGMVLACLVGISSLPGVSYTLNWREWRLAQRYGGWMVLILSTAHVLILSVRYWAPAESWPCGVPGITIMSTSLSILVMATKLVALLLAEMRAMQRLCCKPKRKPATLAVLRRAASVPVPTVA